MLQVRLSPLAQADLDGVWEYTMAQWDEGQAQTYVLGLDASMKLLAENPKVVRAIDDKRKGYCKFRH